VVEIIISVEQRVKGIGEGEKTESEKKVGGNKQVQKGE